MVSSGEGRRPERRSRAAVLRDPVVWVDVSQTVKTVAAGVVAWFVATDVFGLDQPFLAPWSAVFVVHATVYRTVRLFEEANILERHDFRDGRARYEEAPETHHDHLINLHTGEVIEFRNEEIEKLQRRVAEDLGFELVDHRLELYAVPLRSASGGKRGA